MADKTTDAGSTNSESKVIRHSYETAEKVMADDDPDANDQEARGTEVGSPPGLDKSIRPTR